MYKLLVIAAILTGCFTATIFQSGKANVYQRPKPSPWSVEDVYSNAAVSSDAVVCASVSSNLMAIEKANAVDAAIAGIICSCVVNFHSCGIGGGAFINIYIKSERKSYILDLRDEAPGSATENMFNDDPLKSQYGGTSVAVFGLIRGLHELHMRLGGSVAWEKLLQPSIRLAGSGIPASEHMARAAAQFFMDPHTQGQYQELRRLLTHPHLDRPIQSGDTVMLPKVAATLQRLAREPNAINNGSLTASILAELHASGSSISARDLANYKPKWRSPVSLHLASSNLTVLTAPPPSGGALAAFALSVLDKFDWKNEKRLHSISDAARFFHRFAEVMKFTYARRARLADEDFVDMRNILANLTSESYAEDIRDRISDLHTLLKPEYERERGESRENMPQYVTQDDHGTSHFSLISPDGDAVSATSSINHYFGSKLLGHQSGIVYNSQMDDFSRPASSSTKAFDVRPAPYNFIRAHKRPQSSMSPLIVISRVTGHGMAVLGAAGGSRIISATSQVAAMTLQLGLSLKEAVDYPRLHHQFLPQHISTNKRFPKSLLELLHKKGHSIVDHDSSISVVSAILRQGAVLHCNSDHRKMGLCGGF